MSNTVKPIGEKTYCELSLTYKVEVKWKFDLSYEFSFTRSLLKGGERGHVWVSRSMDGVLSAAIDDANYYDVMNDFDGWCRKYIAEFADDEYLDISSITMTEREYRMRIEREIPPPKWLSGLRDKLKQERREGL